LARALATEDEQARYDFARRYPDEPVARGIWAGAETRLRQEFEQRSSDARTAADAKIDADRVNLDARLAAAAKAFEGWLADERNAAAKGPRPDPRSFIEPVRGVGDQLLRDQIAALSGALAQAKAREDEFDAAAKKIKQLSSQLTAAQAAATGKGADRKSPARVWALAGGIGVLGGVAAAFLWLSGVAPSVDESVKLKTQLANTTDALAAANDRAAKLQRDLEVSRSQVQLATTDLEKVRASTTGADKKLSDATAALTAANDRAAKLQLDVDASRSRAQLATTELEGLHAASSGGDKKLSDATAALAAANDRAAKSQSDLDASRSRAQAAAAELDRVRAATDEADRKLSAATAAIAATAENASKLQADLDAEEKLYSGLENKYAAAGTDCHGEVLFADSFSTRKPEWRGDFAAATTSDFKFAVRADESPKFFVVQTTSSRMSACVLVAFPNKYASSAGAGPAAGFVFWASRDAMYSVAFFPVGMISALAKWGEGSGQLIKQETINSAVAIGANYRLEIRIEERSVRFLVDGVMALEYSEPSRPGGSGVGLFARSRQPTEIDFSNFAITR
jgi:hypothetical protein